MDLTIINKDKNKIMKRGLIILTALVTTLILTSCREDKSGVEKAADSVEDAADDVGDAVEDAVD
ncbi:hypothetical protein [Zunongwangia sp. HGR-M22]|uniref:hypothetical protein n=2 Tax=unclassified Zunongwangia TaxID=2632541 RepID=UPI0022DD7273|nr:hypothetical protein [Zunongwangia sp. HGR-M22]WBL25064.1 hypothetical protein PBT91_14315 [Zunongwangia sp. HGR-M22]